MCEKDNRNAQVLVEAGQMFQVIADIGNEKYVKIYVHDHKNLLASADVYCLIDDTYDIVDDKLWNILLAIRELRFRIKIIQNVRFRNFLTNLKVGYEININGKTLGKYGQNIPCIIKYIGPVPEIAPGIFFGFKTKVCVFIQ